MNRYIRILTYSFFILKLRVLSVITLFFPRDIPNLSGNDKAKEFVDDDINLEKEQSNSKNGKAMLKVQEHMRTKKEKKNTRTISRTTKKNNNLMIKQVSMPTLDRHKE